MCGIAGWSGRPPREDAPVLLRALTGRLAHRGPDGEGFLDDDGSGIALGHRRLAILDLTPASAQPMVDAETGVALCYNGELYNFRELRRELETRGRRFRSSGDVEVVLRAYLEWGASCFERLAGMFALAIRDPRDRMLWLARDAMGMKPLYMSRGPEGALFFASEARALAAVPGLELEPSPEGVARYLEFGFQVEEHATIFAGVERLAPGEVVAVRDGQVGRRFRHFEPPRSEPAEERGEAERVEELAATLEQVVREHLVADVGVGVLLSGGLDSSVVTALAARASRPTTVSMGFARSSHDERGWARRVAESVGSRHYDLLLEPEEVLSELESCAAVFDDLFADWGTVTTRILYRRCRALGLKVVLVGEGADELFGGYPIFEEAGRPVSELSTFRLYRRYVSRRWGSSFPAFRALFGDLAEQAGDDPFDAIRLFESRRQLPGNYVMKVDKAAMSVSVEARAPYLDRRVATLAYRTPRSWLLRSGTDKYLLRAVAAGLPSLPPALARRPKAGGSVAFSWLEEVPVFRARAMERVLARGAWAERLGLRRAMERYFSGRSGDPAPLPLSLFAHLSWRLLLLEYWSAALFGERSRVAVG